MQVSLSLYQLLERAEVEGRLKNDHANVMLGSTRTREGKTMTAVVDGAAALYLQWCTAMNVPQDLLLCFEKL